MTYAEYISQFKIYDSFNKAKAKGYEAHHIEPRALQKEGTLDDRCVRLTPFQHIYAHYLLALERNDAIVIFFLMVNRNKFKLSDIEKVTLEELEQWASLREKGRAKASKIRFGKKMTDEQKQRLSESHIGHQHSEETKAKMSKTRKGQKHSPEWSKKISQALKGNQNSKGKKLTDETKERMSKSQKGKKRPKGSIEKMTEHQRAVAKAYREDNPLNLNWYDFQKEYKKRNVA